MQRREMLVLFISARERANPGERYDARVGERASARRGGRDEPDNLWIVSLSWSGTRAQLSKVRRTEVGPSAGAE